MTITIEWLKERCEIEFGHWIWQRATCNEGKDPRAGFGGKIVNVRREAWKLAHDGREPRADRFVVCGCKEHLCVRPECMVEITRSVAQRGKVWSPQARASFTRARRAWAKVTPELAAQLRTSTDSSYIEAQRHGIDPSTVQGIRRGRIWRDHTNPFAGLLQ